MEKGACNKAGCTVDATGICLLSHTDLSTCPHFHVVEGITTESVVPISEPAELLTVPSPVARRFPGGLELDTQDAAEIMRARYAYLVGILGSSDAGKTCFLLSLYLMASRGALPSNYLFAGSETLQGFEARARRVREWKGGSLPTQLADHTTLADPRQPAFLHLALREADGDRRLLNMMLTDLPGEWSKNLVDRVATAERFAFLRRADGIVVVVDGPLLDSKARHPEIQRSRHLLERLVESVGVTTTTPLVLLVSKCDRLQMRRPLAIDELERHARILGFSPEVVLCAAFSSTPKTVQDGRGVFETVEKILAQDLPRCEDIPISSTKSNGRAFLDFRHLEEERHNGE